MTINLIDARRGLHNKCLELFVDKKIAEQIYRYLCGGIEDCGEVEPKHGQWIKENKVYPELPNDGDYYWYCSECKSQDQHNINVEVPFCWHCGTRMDEVKNG